MALMGSSFSVGYTEGLCLMPFLNVSTSYGAHGLGPEGAGGAGDGLLVAIGIC
jgi:hypothetical protein